MDNYIGMLVLVFMVVGIIVLVLEVNELFLWIWIDGCRSYGDGGREVDYCFLVVCVCGEYRLIN